MWAPSTVSTLAGIEIKTGHYKPEEIRSIWEKRKKIIVSENDCWIWQGAKSKDGYGHFGHNKVTILAHRMTYQLCVGDIPDKLHVCHNCPGGDNPACCNPSHLFVGTDVDNVRDCVKKGRHTPASLPGESNPSSKLTAEQVIEIRRLYKIESYRGYRKELAAEYNVSSCTIRRILDGKSWKNLPSDGG